MQITSLNVNEVAIDQGDIDQEGLLNTMFVSVDLLLEVQLDNYCEGYELYETEEFDKAMSLEDDHELTLELTQAIQKALHSATAKKQIVYKVVHVNGGCYESVAAPTDSIKTYKLGATTNGNFLVAFDTLKNARTFQKSHGDTVILKCESVVQKGTPGWSSDATFSSYHTGTVFCSQVKPIQLFR